MFIKYTLAVLVSHSSSRPPRSSPSLALGRVHLPRLSTPTTIQFYNMQHDVTHLDLELIHDKSSSSMSWKRVEYRTTVTNFTWSVVTDSSADLVPGVCLAEHGLPLPPPAHGGRHGGRSLTRTMLPEPTPTFPGTVSGAKH